MIKISSEQELLELFRPIDRDDVVVPAEMKFPVVVKDYVAWLEPSGARTFLVCEDAKPGAALAVVFKRDNSGAEVPARMCEWCHSVRTGGAVGLLTATASETRRVGVQVCRDLSCKENALSPPGIHDMRESLAGGQRLARIHSKMIEFARRNLF